VLYTPSHFDASTSSLVSEIIHRYNFATLITVKDDLPVISHLPFLYQAERSMLFGHMARANPQWRTFRPEKDVLVIFQGPHAYVSPRWYQPQPDNVPTWNYAVVHVHGTPKVVQDETAAYEVMLSLVARHDPDWKLSLSDQDRREMMREIVVFEIEVKKLEAKFKLSQNRPEGDAEHVAEELSGCRDQVERETGEMMRRLGMELVRERF